MARWRDTKRGKTANNDTKNNSSLEADISLNNIAPIPARIKAFIVDMFMIMMPIMYITTYIFMDGKDDFQHSTVARWITAALYGIITISFWVIKGQTPGHKAYTIKIVDSTTKKNIGIIKAFIRYFFFLLSAVTIVLAFLPFFREDKKTLQDLVANTTVIKEN